MHGTISNYPNKFTITNSHRSTAFRTSASRLAYSKVLYFSGLRSINAILFSLFSLFWRVWSPYFWTYSLVCLCIAYGSFQDPVWLLWLGWMSTISLLRSDIYYFSSFLFLNYLLLLQPVVKQSLPHSILSVCIYGFEDGAFLGGLDPSGI